MTKKQYQEARDYIYAEVRRAAYAKSNKFGYATWPYHITRVVEYSLKLGRKMKADLQVLEIAALLHDYAAVVDEKLYEKHNLHSAVLGEKILRKFDFPEDKINQIKHCIHSHRGSLQLSRNTKEAAILASADAMSHFAELVQMFHLTYQIHGYDTRSGARWLKGKLERSWSKIIPEGKNMIRKDYEIAMYLLNKSINNKYDVG